MRRVKAGLEDHIDSIQALTSGSSDGIILTDLHQQIRWANAAMLAMHAVSDISDLGSTTDEYLTKFRVRFRPDEADPEGGCSESSGVGSSRRDHLIELTPTNGRSPCWIYRVRSVTLMGSDGSPIGLVQVLRPFKRALGDEANQASSLLAALPQAAALLQWPDIRLIEYNDLFDSLLTPQLLAEIKAHVTCVLPLAHAEPVTNAAHPRTKELRLSGGRELSLVVTLAPHDEHGRARVLASLFDKAQVAVAASTDEDEAADLETFRRAADVLVPVSLMAFDASFTIVSANDSWLDWLGYAKAYVIGSDVRRFVSASSLAHMQADITGALPDGGLLRDMMVDFVRVDGAIARSKLSAQVKTDDDGELELVIAASIDLSEQSQWEEAFAATFADTPTAMLTVRADGLIITDVNQATCKLLDWQRQDMIGKTLDQLSIFETRAVRLLAESASQQPANSQNTDVKVRTSQGAVLDCCLGLQQILGPRNRLLLLTLQDLTDYRRDEAQLCEAIDLVMGDTSWFSRSVIEKLAALRQPPKSGRQAAMLDDLTPREREVLGLISHGLTDSDIAARLGLSRSTVRNHVATLYSKIDVHSRSAAIVWARERAINLTWPPRSSLPTASTPRAKRQPIVSIR